MNYEVGLLDVELAYPVWNGPTLFGTEPLCVDRPLCVKRPTGHLCVMCDWAHYVWNGPNVRMCVERADSVWNGPSLCCKGSFRVIRQSLRGSDPLCED